MIHHGSVSIPIYAGTVGGKVRYTIAFYLDGRRQRRMFTDIEKAKREAKLAAEKIQRGLAGNNDLTSRDREIFHAASKILSPIDTPMLAAVQGFLKQNQGITLGMTVPQVYEELLVAKKQDGVSASYLGQLKAILKLFADSFPGPILHVKSEEIDQWLRKTTSSPVTRNNRLRNVRVMVQLREAAKLPAEFRSHAGGTGPQGEGAAKGQRDLRCLPRIRTRHRVIPQCPKKG